MKTTQEIFAATRTITFDCYGTLVDWETGLEAAISALFGAEALGDRASAVFDAYVEAEAAVEAEGYRPYRAVLAEAARRVGLRFGLAPRESPDPFMADQLRGWQPFPDTNEAVCRLKERFRLGILSNIDRDLLEATIGHLGVAFDFTVTAEDVRAYKPAHLHFHRLINAHEGRDGGLHVAQSIFHDGAPCGQLEIPFVWINRRKERAPTERDGARPIAVFPDLGSFADEICG